MWRICRQTEEKEKMIQNQDLERNIEQLEEIAESEILSDDTVKKAMDIINEMSQKISTAQTHRFFARLLP